MTALYIIGGILLFFVAVGFIRAEIVITYAADFGLTLRLLGIPIRIVPGKEKKIRLKDYTPKAVAKREQAKQEKALKKAEKKSEKKKQKEEKKQADKKKKAENKAAGIVEPKRPIGEIISLVTDAVGTLFARFGRHLRIRIARLHIGVATGDAASTAILYGGVVQGVAYLCALLDSFSTLRHPAKADVDVHADYLSEKMTVDIEIGFSFLIWQLFDIIFGTAFAAVRHLGKIRPVYPDGSTTPPKNRTKKKKGGKPGKKTGKKHTAKQPAPGSRGKNGEKVPAPANPARNEIRKK